jgi:L-ascorbate metabolism protein UlaG (beta-lactamase superfamily)
VLEPVAGGGDEVENLALAQADHELARTGPERRRVATWETVEVGQFRITALPAVDGIGDPQVAWLVEADDFRVLHLGDTIFHGYWWRMARRHGPFDAVFLPVNRAVLSFPHRQPSSPLAGALGPDEAAIAAQILGARLAIPIHAEGYEIAGVYEPVAGAVAKFEAAADARGVPVRVLELGEAIDLAAAYR